MAASGAVDVGLFDVFGHQTTECLAAYSRRLFYPEIRLKTAPFSPDVFFAFLLGMQNPRTNPRLASGEIQWGSDESGRDPVVSALLGRNPSAAKRGSLNW